jgi:hypothetical protein
MFVKEGYAAESLVNQIHPDSIQDKLASPEIVHQLEKFAATVRAIAPQSNDFLYFSIIFLKSAEACLIDDFGNAKKIGNEKAWGYFDEKWKWHGNVKPHKNNNGDIFPETELKIATKDWIGRPLCVDHKSDTVDGVRGIILDTYYDEKLKQVVGLCAVDKINYADLARKISTGVIRYGSMGTAVETSVCTECGKKASTPKEYCLHIINKEAWGEINIGLRPIEYSLVVQPAEPGARLLRCIASINKHRDELNSFGVDLNSVMSKIPVQKLDGLDILLGAVCGPNGCSIDERERIVKGYVNTNGFSKSASDKTAVDSTNFDLTKSLAEFAKATGYTLKDAPDLYFSVFGEAIRNLPLPESELKSTEPSYGGEANVSPPRGAGDVSDVTGTASSGLLASDSGPNPDSFMTGGVGPETYAFSSDQSDKEGTIKTSSIMEDIMNEARKRKRAELRRRIAYHFGGTEGSVEPKGTYKDEGAGQNKTREKEDKQMLVKELGGADGMAPGDDKTKKMVFRAEDKSLANKKTAYHFGGAEPKVEPATFKSEDYHKYWNTDKQMYQDGNMGKDSGTFPGDDKTKKELFRTAAYNGPALSTKFKQKRRFDGTIDKEASCFEVYSGDKMVIAATAKDIFGEKLAENWTWVTSKDYAKAVVAEIREKGVSYVGRSLTKSAQEMPAELPAELPAAGDMGAPPMDMPVEAPAEEAPEPKQVVEDALVSMENNIEDVRDALSTMIGENGDVEFNINVDKEGVDAGEKLALSKNVYKQLKVTLAEASDSADELALLAETYDKYAKLSKAQQEELNEISRDALNDSANITGQSKTLVSMAKAISTSMVKTSGYVEETKVETAAPVAEAKSEDSELVTIALDIRKQRRQDLLKQATQKLSKKATSMGWENKAPSGAAVSEAKDSKTDALSELLKKIKDKVEDKDLCAEIEEALEKAHDKKSKDESDAKDGCEVSEVKDAPAKTEVSEAKDKPAEAVVAPKENKAEDKKEEVKEEVKEEKETVKAKLAESFIQKKAEEEREFYKLKLRRAYDVGMEMQRKNLIAATKPALDRQVDSIMEFDDKAFEAFKRSISSLKDNRENVKTASDLGGLNVGKTEEVHEATETSRPKMDASSLAKLLWK